MSVFRLCMAVVAWASVSGLATEEIRRVAFAKRPDVGLFRHTWGDTPVEVLQNGRAPGPEQDADATGRLRLRFSGDLKRNLTYWALDFASPVPIVKEVQSISFRVKTNVDVSIKVSISPFDFIYHGPGVKAADGWQDVVLENAYTELAAWCVKGSQDPAEGLIPGVIVALVPRPDSVADITVADAVVRGADGANRMIEQETRRRRFRRVRVSVVTLPWSEEGRRLNTVLDRLDEAAAAGADIVCLPMECIASTGETIPGPSSLALAAKAREHGMYVIGNLREREADRVYVTSFLCDRTGALLGKYRKSHKMPDEDMDLGRDLPVFDTDFGRVAMRIGSDRYFADIDHVYTANGAGIIFWSQQPEPIEDEHLQDFPSAGRALDYGVFIACSRYSFAEPGWITNKFPPYRGCPIGRSYICNRDGQRVAATLRKGSVATAVIPARQMRGAGRGPNPASAFAVLTQPVALPEPREWAKRRIRVTCIENHVGIDDLLGKLDAAGELGSDLVCTYEFVWIRGGAEAEVARLTAAAKANLKRVAQKADQWNMYVLIAGVIDRLERNEAICYGRDGREVGRYFKIVRTHKEQILGDDTPIIETDFGRLGVRICADNALVELDRAYGVKGADILLFPTQDWGPDALHRDLREISRCMDAQLFHVQATHSATEARHRSMIVEPTGVVVARSQYLSNGLVSAVIDLDKDRPRRYVRTFTPHTPAGYLPQYQPTEFPEVRNDLKTTILRQRRPELYQVLAPKSSDR